MPLVNAYATLDEFDAWAPGGLEVDTDVKVAVINAASRWIDQHCFRHFWQDTATARVFETCNRYTLELGNFNDLVSVTSVATDTSGDGTFDSTWASSDYQLLPLAPSAAPETRPYTHIRAISTKTFPSVSYSGGKRLGRVEITGDWGWPAVPDAVHQACLIQSFRELKRRDSPEGVSGFDQFGTIRISNRADPDVVQLLAPYRRVAVLVA